MQPKIQLKLINLDMKILFQNKTNKCIAHASQWMIRCLPKNIQYKCIIHRCTLINTSTCSLNTCSTHSNNTHLLNTNTTHSNIICLLLTLIILNFNRFKTNLQAKFHSSSTKKLIKVIRWCLFHNNRFLKGLRSLLIYHLVEMM